MLSLRAEFAFVPALAGLLWFPAGNFAHNPQVQEQATVLAPSESPAALLQVPSRASTPWVAAPSPLRLRSRRVLGGPIRQPPPPVQRHRRR